LKRRILPQSRRHIGLLTEIKQNSRLEGQGLPFPLAAENDVIFGLQRYSIHCCGGLLGIEVKRNLADYAAAVRQTVVEWLVLSNNSWFPCVQVLTDLERGGIALFFKADENGGGSLFIRVFPTLDLLMSFCKTLLSNIPENLGADEGSGGLSKLSLPQELAEPARYVFKLPMTRTSSDIVEMLCRLREDPLQEQDLSGFDLELGGCGAVFNPPWYIS